MTKYYYKKSFNSKSIVRILALSTALLGISAMLYMFFPLISWQIYFADVFASNNVATPIPKNTIVNPTSLQSLLTTGVRSLSGVDYTNAQNWFPDINLSEKNQATISHYNLTIPTLGITNAVVSSSDYNLAKHLVNYPGTPVPGQNGNAVIFGHSTLPQLFNPKDYKTIFAILYRLKIDDEVEAVVEGVSYRYKIYNITVVEASDTSFFSQQYDNSYITLVTCTPPGTTWKRLILKARLMPIN